MDEIIIHFTWQDWLTSSESFPIGSNTEFYEYMDSMKQDGYEVKSMTIDDHGNISNAEWYEEYDGVKIEIIW